MDQYNGVSIPMEPNIQLRAADQVYLATKNDKLEYQQAIGSIMYAMLGTHPDLAYPISTLSKFYTNPSYKHASATQHIFCYLQKTTNVGIILRGIENDKESSNIEAIKRALKDSNTGTLRKGLNSILGFTDSDWADDIDSRKSTSGYVFTLYGGAIS